VVASLLQILLVISFVNLVLYLVLPISWKCSVAGLATVMRGDWRLFCSIPNSSLISGLQFVLRRERGRLTSSEASAMRFFHQRLLLSAGTHSRFVGSDFYVFEKGMVAVDSFQFLRALYTVAWTNIFYGGPH